MDNFRVHLGGRHSSVEWNEPTILRPGFESQAQRENNESNKKRK